MQNKIRIGTLAIALAFSGGLSAQSVGDLAKVQAETVLIRAKAARAKAAAELADAGGGAVLAQAGRDATLPVVRGVYGSAELYATFLYANGSTVDAGQGVIIPGGYRVAELSATRVELSRRGERFTLGFSDRRPFVTEADKSANAQDSTTAPTKAPGA